MNQVLLLEILADQKNELSKLAKLNFCSRREESQINLNSKKAQVVIGVRRSGKSILCYNALHKSGVNYAYVNFDDERLVKLKDDGLNDVLRCLYQLYGNFTHLYMDEVQNVEGWHLFVNRMLRSEMKIVITGSNAKLLSSELSTHLTGRYHEIKLYPFSYSEYCIVKGIDISDRTTIGDGLKRKAFDDYLREGAFPEIVNGEENTEEYMDTLVSGILERDIIQRFKVRYKDAFIKMANHLMNMAPCEIVHNVLKDEFNLKSSHTVENYTGYLYQAFLLLQLKKFSPKSSERIRNSKCYTVDVSLMNARKDAFARENLGWRLETIVYVELMRKHSVGHDIYFYKGSSFEADFVVCHRSNVMEIIQVCYDINSAKTYSREINGLIKTSKATGCDNLILITAYEEDTINANGKTIKIMPCYKWLLM